MTFNTLSFYRSVERSIQSFMKVYIYESIQIYMLKTNFKSNLNL